MGPLVNVTGVLMPKDTKNARVLDGFFASVFTVKSRLLRTE